MIKTQPVSSNANLSQIYDPQIFYNAIENAKNDGKEKDIVEKRYGTKNSKWFGAYLSVYTVSDYKEMKMFLLSDSSGGVAIKPSGDIVSVFKNMTLCKVVDLIGILLPMAINNGGTHLDCFDGVLPKKYSKYGFKPVAKIKFDVNFAPKEWNYDRDNHPAIVFLSLNIEFIKEVDMDDEIRGPKIKKLIDQMAFSSSYEEAVEQQLASIRTS